MINNTSVLAFNSIRGGKVANTQSLVYEVIKELGEANNNDIAIKLERQINTITPRVVELRQLGLITWSRDDKDPRTRRLTSYWKIAGK